MGTPGGRASLVLRLPVTASGGRIEESGSVSGPFLPRRNDRDGDRSHDRDRERPGLGRSAHQGVGRRIVVRCCAARSDGLERRTREIGRELFDRIGRGPGPGSAPGGTTGSWPLTLDDPLVRVQLFRFIDALPALKDAGVGPAAPGRVSRRGRRSRSPGGCDLALRLAPEGSTRAEWLAAAARTAAGVMARKFIAGATPDEALQTVLALRRRRLAFTADLLGEAVISEAEADWYQQTCLDADPRAGRPARRRPRGPADRPRPARPDPAGQPLAQAVEPDRPLRADPRRGVDRPRRRPAPADPPRGPRAGRLCPRRHGAVRLPGADLRAVLPGARGARVPRLARRRDRGAGLPRRRPRPSCGCSATGSSAAGRRSRSGWSRGRTGTTRSLTARRLGWPEPVYLEKWQSDASFERCTRFLLRASRPAAAGLRQPQRPQPGPRDRRGRGDGPAAVGLRAPDALRHGRRDPARAGRPRPSGAGLHAVRRPAAGHGLPGAPAAGEHVERIVPQGELRPRRPGSTTCCATPRRSEPC